MRNVEIWVGPARLVRLPVAGECDPELAERVAGGQPVVLTLDGRPVAVAVDLETWAAVELDLATPAA